jgi:ubiquinone/menaquinone biosynthesis C-methylase UbiE
METESTQIYSKLAPLYDLLMADVDYDSWADYIDEIMQTHHIDPLHIHEMACGTGSVSISLAELECYSLSASDLSPQMIEIAAAKAHDYEREVDFSVRNFLDPWEKSTFDCIFSVFDSINYLQQSNDILRFLEQSNRALKPDGLLIFDFSTPKNSLESVDYLNEAEGEKGNIRFFRTSRYDPETKIHFNEFEIELRNPENGSLVETFKEIHTQRAYTLQEMLALVEQSPYQLVAKYDGFDLIDATKHSARVTMVLRCQKTQ